MIGLTFSIIAVYNYHRDVNITQCYEANKIVYINYSYFPLGKSYRQRYDCKNEIVKHYEFHSRKRKASK